MNNPYRPPSSEIVATAAEADPAKMHGLLKAYLWLIVVINALSSLATVATSSALKQTYPAMGNIQLTALALAGLLNIVFAFALLKFRRWGFYGTVAMAFVALAINLSIGISIQQALVGLAGPVILVILLHIGGERRAWPRLK